MDFFTLAGALTVTYILINAIYKLYFHPLSKYPGPFWARLTVFPSWYHTLHGDRHVWLWRLQDQYGSTFRYQPNSILVNTPTANREIYGPKANFRKGDYYKAWPRNVNAINTWNAVDIEVHARKRRVLNNAFSDRALRSAEPFVQANTDRWCELIGQQTEEGTGWSKSLNMADWTNYLVFDILGDLCFGKSFEMKEEGSDMRYVISLMQTFLEVMHPVASSPISPLWVWLKPRGLDALMDVTAPSGLKNWRKFVEKCLTSRTAAEEKLKQDPKPEHNVRKDFFHYLFQAKDPETGELGYDLDELYSECELLIIAGSDTTANVMAAAFFYLARNIDATSKLATELLSTFSSYDEIKSGSKLYSCTYLRAFLNEVLRMNPPVSLDLQREVLPGGAVVDGQYFPPRTNVSTSPYCLHYNRDVFSEPFKFRPERWILDKKDNSSASAANVDLAESALTPFSIGQRGCVGKNLAWLEMLIVLAKVVYMFELQQDPTNNLGAGDANGKIGRRTIDQYQTYDTFVSMRYGPMVQFKRRNI